MFPLACRTPGSLGARAFHAVLSPLRQKLTSRLVPVRSISSSSSNSASGGPSPSQALSAPSPSPQPSAPLSPSVILVSPSLSSPPPSTSFSASSLSSSSPSFSTSAATATSSSPSSSYTPQGSGYTHHESYASSISSPPSLPPPPAPILTTEPALSGPSGSHTPYFVDTHKVVTQLERHFSPTVAEILAQSMISVTSTSAKELEQNVTNKDRHEMQRHLSQAETRILRNELLSYEKAQFVASRTKLQAIDREIEQLRQKFQDDMSNLKTNLTIEFNDQKTLVREDRKSKDLKLSEINYRLALQVSDLRGEIEAAKLDIISYTVASLVAIVVFIGLGFRMNSERQKKRKTESQEDLFEDETHAIN